MVLCPRCKYRHGVNWMRAEASNCKFSGGSRVCWLVPSASMRCLSNYIVVVLLCLHINFHYQYELSAWGRSTCEFLRTKRTGNWNTTSLGCWVIQFAYEKSWDTCRCQATPAYNVMTNGLVFFTYRISATNAKMLDPSVVSLNELL